MEIEDSECDQGGRDAKDDARGSSIAKRENDGRTEAVGEAAVEAENRVVVVTNRPDECEEKVKAEGDNQGEEGTAYAGEEEADDGSPLAGVLFVGHLPGIVVVPEDEDEGGPDDGENREQEVDGGRSSQCDVWPDRDAGMKQRAEPGGD